MFSLCHSSLPFWACRHSFLETLICVQAGNLLLLVPRPWQQFLRPGAHSCLLFLLLGPTEMLLVRIRILAYTTCSICPFSSGSHFPQGRGLPAACYPCSFLLVRTDWITGVGALGRTGTKSFQWDSCLLAARQLRANQGSGDHLQWCLTQGTTRGYLARHGPKLFEDGVSKKTPKEKSCGSAPREQRCLESLPSILMKES